MQPLAERLRPKTLDEYIGQKHLVGPGAILRKMIDAGRISSFILWGPPGVGKTTLAQIIANKLETPFYTLSAVTSGVKDVREVIDRAKSNRFSPNPARFCLSMKFIGLASRSRTLCWEQWKRYGDTHRCHHGEPVVRSDSSSLVPLPALCAEISGERRSTGTSGTCH